MKISPVGIALIEKFEGIKLKAYRDGNGKWTIGYGHLEPECGSSAPITTFETQQQAEKDLCIDISSAEEAVNKLVDAPLSQNQFDALVSFTYNEGWGRLRDSTLLKVLNMGNFIAAQNNFLVWDIINGKQSEGLLARRQAEALLFGRAD